MKAELDTYVRVKYGVPTPTREYLVNLPPDVLFKVSRNFLYFVDDESIDFVIKDVLLCLRAPITDVQKPTRDIWAENFYQQLESALREYHEPRT